MENIPQNQIRWDIFSFYKKAIHHIKLNKKILLLAIGAMIFAGSFSPNFNIPSSNSSDTDTPKVSSEKNEVIDGFSFESNPIIQEVISGVKSVPLSIYGILGVGLLINGLFVFINLSIALAWSEASLIFASSKDENDTSWSLKDVIIYSLHKVKSFIWINIVPNLILTLSFGILSMIIFGSFLLKDVFPPITYISGILTVVFAVMAIYASVKTQASILLAKRTCIYENLGGKSSFISAWKLTQGNILKMFRLGSMNALLGFCLTILALLPMIPVVLIFYFAFKAQLFLKVSGVITGSVFSLIIIMLVYAVPILHTAIKYLSWNYAYLFFKQEKSLKELK